MPRFVQCALFGLACVTAASRSAAQGLPDGPLRTAGGRVTIGAEVSATVSPEDSQAYFNYTDYERNTLRMLRLSTSAVWRPAPWLALAGELRSEDLHRPAMYAAYARVRPWQRHGLDLLAGRIPPVFGAFARQSYAGSSTVIGYPLAYQYLTSLRPDAAPLAADDLLRMRGRGWRSSFPAGSQTPGPGLPLASALRWDTGIGAEWTRGPVQLRGAVTSGTLSNPRVRDDNGGRQLAGRLALEPTPGLVLGLSGSSGPWVARTLDGARSGRQSALGADAEYSRDHWIVRGELVFSRWALPWPLPPSNASSVAALGHWVEGRYRFTPRLFAAGRLDRLGFSRLRGTATLRHWDAPVSRFEAAAGWYLRRTLVARAGLQSNRRDGGRVRQRTFPTAQLTWWF